MGGLSGDWRAGTVRGWRTDSGWGAAVGYPGLRPDPGGPLVGVQVFTSGDLAAHWTRLDAFEGAEYERVEIEVNLDGELLIAQIYALRPPPGDAI